MAGGKNDLFVKLFSSRRHTRNVCHYYYILNFMCWGIEGGSKRRSKCFGGGGGGVAIEKKLCVWGIKKVRVNRENQ